MKDLYTIVGLGELIWDLLPTGKQLGGAPTNFAYISRLLGNRTFVASRVGNDSLGDSAIHRLDEVGIETAFVQRDSSFPTGTVGVVIDQSGEPDFRVNPGSAWDHLEWTEEWRKLANSTDGVCFGTLGQREVQARETIHRFLEHTPRGALRLFDVNLRHAFFTPELLVQSLRFSTVVKLNNHELMQVASMLDIAPADELSVARTLLKTFELDLLAVSRGSGGSLLVTSTDAVEHAGFQAKVVDTIGAGDSFAAALAYASMQNAPLEIISEVANRVGAWLVTQRGATPPPDKRLLESIRCLLE